MGHDVRVIRVVRRVVLMVGLGLVESFECGDLCDERAFEEFRPVQLLDVAFGDALLLLAGVEDGRAVVRADVGPLPVQLGRVVCDGKEDLEELAVGDLGRVVGDANGLGVPGVARADRLVVGRPGGTSRVPGRDPGDPFDVLEDGLDAPEAATRQDGRLLAFCGRKRGVQNGVRCRDILGDDRITG